MLRHALLAVLLGFGATLSLLAETSASDPVRVTGLKAHFEQAERVEVSVANMSGQELNVNVALEGLVDGVWREVLASVSDAEHPLGKMVTLQPIPAGGALRVSYHACTSIVLTRDPTGSHAHKLAPCGAAQSQGLRLAGVMWRLRVDVPAASGGKTLRTVRSDAYTMDRTE